MVVGRVSSIRSIESEGVVSAAESSMWNTYSITFKFKFESTSHNKQQTNMQDAWHNIAGHHDRPQDILILCKAIYQPLSRFIRLPIAQAYAIRYALRRLDHNLIEHHLPNIVPCNAIADAILDALLHPISYLYFNNMAYTVTKYFRSVLTYMTFRATSTSIYWKSRYVDMHWMSCGVKFNVDRSYYITVKDICR
jgi:hypothetical protein